ncbi:xylose isomerase-like protein, partial [Mycena sp. CBHHK59/15]
DHQAAAAQDLSSKIDALGLKVLCLQPLRHFEGLLDEEARQARFTEALALFRVMLILKTDLLLIPSSFLPAHEISPDAARIAADLRDLADLAASVAPHLRIGYEALAWGTHVDTWQAAWAVVQRVARANAGLVLDSFNLLARVYADPTRASGVCAGDADAALRASLAELVAAVPPHSIFLLQIADAARAAPSEVASAPLPRLAWSRTRRLFPGERARGAYLPVVPFMHAVVSRLGCSLAWSLEYFNADLECTEDGEAAAKELARRGMKGLRWLWDAVVAEEEGRGEVVGGGSCGVAVRSPLRQSSMTDCSRRCLPHIRARRYE